MQSWDSLLKQLVDTRVIPGTLFRVLLFGPPRTGKSTIGTTLFPNAERVTIHRGISEDHLIGGFALGPNGSFWADGPAIRALRQGKTLVLDEVDKMSSDIACILHALLDYPAGITLPSGERVDAAPGYCVIGTTNALPISLSPAIYDRFDLILCANTLSAGAQQALGSLAKAAEAVVGRGDGPAYHAWSRPATVGLLLAMAKLRARGSSDDQIVSMLGFSNPSHQADMLTLLASGS